MIETRKQNFLYKSVKEIELICKGVNQMGLLKDTSLREKDRERRKREKITATAPGFEPMMLETEAFALPQCHHTALSLFS